jgi:hypothetical protein
MEATNQNPRQRGLTVDGSTRGSIMRLLSATKINRTTSSTTVAELYALMKTFGTCLFLKGLWVDLSGQMADIHVRTDAHNLVTTREDNALARTKGNSPHAYHASQGSLFWSS